MHRVIERPQRRAEFLRLPKTAIRLALAIGLLGIAPAPPVQRLIAPYGVTVGTGDVVYIADPGSQRIFKRVRDQITVVAGSGAPGKDGLVAGGFQNGPAATARFSKPLGIAIAADGSLVVADSGNHCIRRISNGAVSTFGGSPRQAGPADGPLATARFRDPMAIASDGAGSLYVADHGVGIRKISAGAVTTLAIPQAGTAVRAVGAIKRGDSTILFAATDAGFFRYDVEHAILQFFIQQAGLERSIGIPSGFAVIDEHSVLFADPVFRTVRSFWALSGTAGFDGDHSDTLTVPELREDESGFAISSPAQSADAPRLTGPTGVAVRPNGALVVADPSAGHLVDLDPPDLRRPVSDNVADLSVDGNTYYRIALVGNSYAYTDVSYEQSIGAVLERALNSVRSGARPPRPAKVLTVRISAAGTDDEANYVNTFLPGTVDLVVWMFNDNHVYFQIRDHPNTAAVAATDSLIATLRETAATLAADKTKFVVVYQPDADESSSVENRVGRDLSANRFGQNALGDTVRSSLAASGVPYSDLQAPIRSDETQNVTRSDYFSTFDPHPSIEGASELGHAIARALLESAPWQR